MLQTARQVLAASQVPGLELSTLRKPDVVMLQYYGVAVFLKGTLHGHSVGLACWPM